MQLRPYQFRACEAVVDHVRRSVSPVMIDAAPAAGKTFMIADIARQMHEMSGGKRVLVLAPNAQLVDQNFDKFKLTGIPASIFSASAGSKSTRNYIVFGTPLTVKNAISRFQREGKEGYCAIIIDETHELTPTIKSIIDAMREANPNLRVIGLSGTPYRLKEGYIFRTWPDGRVNGDDTARDPYFTHCAYRVSAREMLDEGYITPMVIEQINSEGYETGGIRLLPNGKFNTQDVEMAFEGHGRKTAAVVADVVRFAQTCTGGVMLFAATIQHAHEIMASLPPMNSGLVTGEESFLRGRPVKRKEVIAAYSSQSIRYLVSVGTLTTGFDVPHTQVIALLRFTESAALLTQILGRAWRLFETKASCFLLDYAGNVKKHFPDGDIYNPEIKASKATEGGGGLPCECPSCGADNTFSANIKYLEYEKDKNGYILDLRGQQVMSEFGPISGHHGRRCFGMVQSGPRGEWDRCNYRWTFKPCPHCEAENDIAARYCISCRGEIIDPNEKLAIEFKAMKKDPTKLQTDEVLSMSVNEGISQRGNKTLRVEFVTPFRQFVVWLQPEARSSRGMAEFEMFQRATQDGDPKTITYRKDPDTGFFVVHGYNRQADVDPSQQKEVA